MLNFFGHFYLATITITVEKSGYFIKTSITDQGKGIPAKEIGMLFSPF